MAGTPTQLWSTGPALIYAGPITVSAGGVLFVGTCKVKPVIEVDFLFKPVSADVGGDAPLDRMYVGKRGQLRLDLNRFSYPVVQALCNVPNTALALANVPNPGSPGVDNPGDVGTLVVTEQQTYVLYVVFPYYLKPAYGGGQPTGMVPGYRFPFCSTNKESIHPGTDEHHKTLIVDATRGMINPGFTNVYGSGQMMLYDYGVQGLPPPV